MLYKNLLAKSLTEYAQGLESFLAQFAVVWHQIVSQAIFSLVNTTMALDVITKMMRSDITEIIALLDFRFKAVTIG